MTTRRALTGLLTLTVTAALAGAVAFQQATPRASAATSPSQGQSLCIGHHPQEFVWYSHSCTGHDEPELDPSPISQARPRT